MDRSTRAKQSISSPMKRRNTRRNYPNQSKARPKGRKRRKASPSLSSLHQPSLIRHQRSLLKPPPQRWLQSQPTQSSQRAPREGGWLSSSMFTRTQGIFILHCPIPLKRHTLFSMLQSVDGTLDAGGRWALWEGFSHWAIVPNSQTNIYE
jgi:hypothetical protein